jgi:nucleotide-binding universal stress UspA family protein
MPSNGSQSILCPVDFSETSALGLRFAYALTQGSPAHLTAVYADQFLPPPYFTESGLEDMRKHLKGAAVAAGDHLRQFASRTLGGVRIATQIVEALPVDGILQAARNISADLIVLGTHGRSGFNRLMLGSVAERILRASEIPVLTVPPSTSGLPGSPEFTRILVSVNGSEAARSALEYAGRLARCFSAELTVLHVWEDGKDGAIPELCEWVPKELRANCRLVELPEGEGAAHSILSASSDLGCDLLVLGARRRRFFDSTIIGTTSARVVRHAACPVLTVISRE